VVASKRSRNHFISEKYKTRQLFKLRFLQNSPNVQLYTSASDGKRVGNVPFCESLFSSSVAFYIMAVASPKCRSPQCWIQSREKVNICWS